MTARDYIQDPDTGQFDGSTPGGGGSSSGGSGKLPTSYKGKDGNPKMAAAGMLVDNPFSQSKEFRFSDAQSTKDLFAGSFKTETMPIGDVKSIQDYLMKSQVDAYMQPKDKQPFGLSTGPIAVITVGKDTVIVDGTHRWAAAQLSGNKTIDVKNYGTWSREGNSWKRVDKAMKAITGCSMMGDCPMSDGMDPQTCPMENCPMQSGSTVASTEAPETHAAAAAAAEDRKLYSLLTVKAVDNELRIMRGIATTPTPDRMGDVVEPQGVKFKNPIPLLWQHNTREPVGSAKLGRATDQGITFEAKIPKVTEPGKLKDRLDEVWQSIKVGLVKGVSIGFRAIEASFMKEGGGIHFLKTEVMELSLVTIPANAEATIDEIKAFDFGRANGGATKPGAKDIPKQKVVKKMPMTIAEQISAFEAKRAASTARMETLMQKAADEAQTLDADESTEYDDISTDVKKIDDHLKRLHDLELTNKSLAKPVTGSSQQNGSDARAIATSTRNPVISVKANVPPGTSFTRYAMALAASRGNRWEALNIAKQWHDQTPEVELVLNHDVPSIMKAAVGTATTTDATWASPLIAYNIMASEFIELLRPATIIGRIPGLRRVPFNIQMPRTTTGSTVGWVGENAPKPVSSMAFDTVQLRWAKAAGIIVLTDELVRFSNPAAEAVVRQDMIDAMAQFLDKQFVDPTVAAVTNVSPASITNGVSATVRTGVNQAAFVTDVTTMFGTFLTNNLSTAGGVWLMSQRQALAFSLMLNALGQPFYPGVTAEGGTLLGYPVIASENIPSVGNSPADGTPIIFLLPREIMLADDGQVVIDASNQASVQLDTAPDSPPGAATALISLWQMNMTGLRAERWINWLKRRSTAVAYISNANYA